MSVQNEKFPYAGAIDADGHILEPPDTWEKYIDPPVRRLSAITSPRCTASEGGRRALWHGPFALFPG